jgi:hypothetical protein
MGERGDQSIGELLVTGWLLLSSQQGSFRNIPEIENPFGLAAWRLWPRSGTRMKHKMEHKAVVYLQLKFLILLTQKSDMFKNRSVHPYLN